jgi:hypothetical protein
VDLGVWAAVVVTAGWVAIPLASWRWTWFRADLAFYVFAWTLVTGVVGGYYVLGNIFSNAFHKAPSPEAARPPLAVSGGALVLLLFAVLDIALIRLRTRPISISVPRGFDRWLPGLLAIAVGGLIGTTLFK